MTGAAWWACRRIRTDWTIAAFFVAVFAAALNGTLRVHVLFTERHNPPAFRSELERSAPWLHLSDGVFGLVLLVLAGLLARPALGWSVFLGAIGAGIIIVSIAVEPATTQAGFPKPPSGVRRRPPAKSGPKST